MLAKGGFKEDPLGRLEGTKEGGPKSLGYLDGWKEGRAKSSSGTALGGRMGLPLGIPNGAVLGISLGRPIGIPKGHSEGPKSVLSSSVKFCPELTAFPLYKML